MATRSSTSGFGKFLLGLILGLLMIPAAAILYFHFGHPPVAVADKPFPFEKQAVHVPLHARIDREAPSDAPFGESEDVFEGGAHVYREQCANCHGTPGRDISYSKFMYPKAPQFWGAYKTHIPHDSLGEDYWKISNGIRLTGMPAYNSILTDTEMWQVSILLKNADQPLPDPVEKILTK